MALRYQNAPRKTIALSTAVMLEALVLQIVCVHKKLKQKLKLKEQELNWSINSSLNRDSRRGKKAAKNMCHSTETFEGK